MAIKQLPSFHFDGGANLTGAGPDSLATYLNQMESHLRTVAAGRGDVQLTINSGLEFELGPVDGGDPVGFLFANGALRAMEETVSMDLADLVTGDILPSTWYYVYALATSTGLAFEAKTDAPSTIPGSEYVVPLRVDKLGKLAAVQVTKRKFSYLSRKNVDLPYTLSGRTTLSLSKFIPATAREVNISISAGAGTTIRVFVKGQKSSYEYAQDDQKSFEMPLGGETEIEVTKEGTGTCYVQVLGWIDGNL